MAKLREKQERFVQEYLVDLNATQAAIRAGYSEKTARSMGAENLTKPDIQMAIKAAMEARSERTEITQDMVLKEFAHIAFDDISNYLSFRTENTVVDHHENGTPITEYRTIVDMKDSREIDTRSIAEVSTGPNGQFKFKLYCKDNALLQVGRHLGMFKDKVEMSGHINDPFEGMTTEQLVELVRNGTPSTD